MAHILGRIEAVKLELEQHLPLELLGDPRPLPGYW
jgi:hypothetical protein